MNKLKSLEEHNTQTYLVYQTMYDTSSRVNGIACPKCGEELLDSNPMMILTSHPPKKNIHCPKCDYVGYRVA